MLFYRELESISLEFESIVPDNCRQSVPTVAASVPPTCSDRIIIRRWHFFLNENYSIRYWNDTIFINVPGRDEFPPDELHLNVRRLKLSRLFLIIPLYVSLCTFNWIEFNHKCTYFWNRIRGNMELVVTLRCNDETRYRFIEIVGMKKRRKAETFVSFAARIN